MLFKNIVINRDWVFRTLHGFNILVRKTDGTILNLSPTTSGVMQAIFEEDMDPEVAFSQFQREYRLSEEQYFAFLNTLKDKEVLVNADEQQNA